MVRVAVADRVKPFPTPVTVNGYEPGGTAPGNVTVSVEMKFGAPTGGLKAPEAPPGNPETDSVTCELKPLIPTTLTV